MVIQCSLLTHVHEKNSLAAVLARVFEREAENIVPDQTPRAVPSHEGLCGVLVACEDQTSSYNWKGLILATAAALNIAEPDAFSAIPSVVLQGAVHMFPLVQSLPDDRLILIDTAEDGGACSLAVWAHHVLGLTVLVKSDGPSGLTENQFGTGTSHVVINLRDRSLSWVGDTCSVVIRQPSITLLSVSDNEKLITLKPEPDEVEIDAVFRQSAGGYGTKALESVCGSGGASGEGIDALVHELMMIAVAFAAIVSQQLSTKPRSAFAEGASVPQTLGDNAIGTVLKDSTLQDKSTTHEAPHETEHLKCMISERALMRAAQFLFNTPKLKKKSIMGHVLFFSQRPLNETLEIPHSVSLILDQQSSETITDNGLKWRHLLETVRYLSVVILAFAFVRDLDHCAELPLGHSLEVLSQHILIVRMNQWDGKSTIWIPEDTWFLVLVQLLVGHRTTIDTESTCLISDHGWSIFLSTFGDADPSYTDAGHVVIRRGVPCRNGVWKHAIIDGPPSGLSDSGWKICQTASTKESLQCANIVHYSPPLCGDRHGSFMVNLRFSTECALDMSTDKEIGGSMSGYYIRNHGEYDTRRSGYRELFASLWGVQRTQSCQHESSSITLPLSCASVSGFGEFQMTDLRDTARVLICLTAHSTSARWRALLAIHLSLFVFPANKGIDQVLLRGEDCCFQCAVNQTLVRTGYWFLVL